MITNCLYCDKEFESKKETAKFCSDLCRAIFSQNLRIKNGEITVRIYCIKDPRNNEVFYVGRTIGSLPQRLSVHLKHADTGDRSKRLQDIVSEGLNPTIEELEAIPISDRETEAAAILREEYWIKHFSEQGVALTNKDGFIRPFKPRSLVSSIKSTTKTRSYSVRFTQKVFDEICEAKGFEKAQEVVNYFEDIYKATKSPIADVPTLTRNAEKTPQAGKKSPADPLSTLANPSGDTKGTAKDAPEMSDFMKQRLQSKLGNK